MTTDIATQIQSELEGLDRMQLRRVLAFVRELKKSPIGFSGSELRDVAGTLSEDDARSMMEAIETAYEGVDPNEW